MENVITASRLRENIYSILDEVLETGVPVEILRHGRRLRIVADVNNPPSKLDRLTKRDVIVGDPEDLVHMDWSAYWVPDGAALVPRIAAETNRTKDAKTMTAGGSK